MRIKLLLLGSLALLCRAECVQAGPVGPPKFGRIEVSAFSILSEHLPTLGIDLRERWTGKNVSKLFKGSVANKVPYGTYTLRVSASGFRSAQREVRLEQPEVHVRAQLSVSIECGTLGGISGVVTPLKAGSELWAKLVPVRGT